MKLRLNVPLEDLAYRFNLSKTAVSRVILDWLMVMDVRLKPLIQVVGQNENDYGKQCHCASNMVSGKKLQLLSIASRYLLRNLPI